MGKKTIVLGAPMYMGQFTALMTILLAFFILLNTLTEDQDAGFNAGIGEVQNAFGVKGGLGIFKFSFAGKGALNPIALEKSKDKDADVGFDRNMTISGGGSGNTDSDYEKEPPGSYMRIKINYDFPEGKDLMPADMRDYLKKIGMGITLFNYKIWIRCYCTEYRDELKDAKLASNRATRIMRFLQRYCQIPYDRMLASGSCSNNYIERAIIKPESQQQDSAANSNQQAQAETSPDQGAYFYVFFKKK